MTLSRHLAPFIDSVKNGKLLASDQVHALIKHVEECFGQEEIYLDDAQMDNYLKIIDWFEYPKVFDWQVFLIALHLCTYWKHNNTPRWPDLLCLMGRGGGKDGMIAMESACLISPYNDKIGKYTQYDVDIFAMDKDGAVRPVKDFVDVLERPQNVKKMKNTFHWTLEGVRCKRTKAHLRGYAYNPKARDGMRPGIVIFNEYHAYLSEDNVKVCKGGLGKKPHPRTGIFTTDGHNREGVLDKAKERANRILFQGEDDNGFLPFICCINSDEEAQDEKYWEKANPSYPYLENLQLEMRKEYREALDNNSLMSEFMAKRMNRPSVAGDMEVTNYENIKATKEELPDLTGWQCTAGIDYMKSNDMLSVNLHFKDGDKRYDINHSWLCLKSRDLNLLRVPWKDWAKQGLLTLVDDVDIHPSIICNYLVEAQKKYNIQKLAIDNYRIAFLLPYLKDIGFDFNEQKNMKLVRPSDIMKIVPVIESVFSHQNFVWGDNPVLRWATNNTCITKIGRTSGNADNGNYVYGKIDRQRRKNDAFMALVHSMIVEDEIIESKGYGDFFAKMDIF